MTTSTGGRADAVPGGRSSRHTYAGCLRRSADPSATDSLTGAATTSGLWLPPH
ncbi:hypothetical protein ATKI12_2356 [Kitasatospora sp. Ki12]